MYIVFDIPSNNINPKLLNEIFEYLHYYTQVCTLQQYYSINDIILRLPTVLFFLRGNIN